LLAVIFLYNRQGQQNVDDPSSAFEQAGLAAYLAGDLTGALKALEEAHLSEGLSNDGLLTLGEIYLEMGEPLKAAEALQQVASSEAALRRLAEIHRRLGDYPALHTDLTALVALQPLDPGAKYQLGLLYAAFQPESAPVYLEQAAQLDQQYLDASRQVKRVINDAIKQDEEVLLYMETGRILAALGDWDLAEQAFLQAAQLRPDYAEAWAFYGESIQNNHLIQDRDPEAAREALNKAIALNPESISAHIFMALYSRRQGLLDSATDSLLTAAELDPQNPAIQVELGHCEVEKGDLPAAQLYYEKAASLAPKDPAYWRILAEFSLNNQVQPREIALPAAREALTLTPNDHRSLDVMGYTMYQLGDLISAERFLLQAIEADSSFAPAQLHLGMVYLMQGKDDLALRQLRLVEELAPDSAAARQADRLLNRYFP
jgi:tetratricopeptide (TPR) repeat protein